MIESEVIAVSARDVSLEMRRRLIVFAVLSLAVVLRIYAISLYPLAGDEYGSLLEARTVGLNWNSILYSILMHFWIQFGNSELWLRLPAAVFGIATVGILFKIGERLGGFRTGVVAALFAATSPFNIYHSQEVRFYSFFIFTTALFMLVSIDAATFPRSKRTRVLVLLTSVLLFFSHFLAPLALYAQGGVAWATNLSTSRKRALLLSLSLLFIAACALLVTPAFHHQLWSFYQTYGNAPSSLEPAMMPVSLISLGKVVFAGFILNFGYHVYPMRIAFIAIGAGISAFLLSIGLRRMWRETKWGMLPVAYFVTLIAVYVVLDAAGGRLANGVSPRHVAFVWPIFVILTAMGATRFRRPILYALVSAVIVVNGLSVRAAWQKDWTYGNAVDYRAVAQVAGRWITDDTVIIHDNRSTGPIDFYFPKAGGIFSMAEIHDSGIEQLNGKRVILVSDDWEPEGRASTDEFLKTLSRRYAVVDGYVDYPLFAYLLESRAATATPSELHHAMNQPELPVSNYGLEFQDVHLPVTVNAKNTNMNMLGAYGLPDSVGSTEIELPLSHATRTNRVVLLSNVIDGEALSSGQNIGELVVETQKGKSVVFPLRFGIDTTSWDRQCDSPLNCETVFQWRKRLAVLGQNRYPGSLREFSAGIHAHEFRLPETEEVTAMKIRYTASIGRLYVWGTTLAAN